VQPTPEPEIRLALGYNLCLNIRKLISVVKDVDLDLEAMPTSIFLNDDDDDDDDCPCILPICSIALKHRTVATHM